MPEPAGAPAVESRRDAEPRGPAPRTAPRARLRQLLAAPAILVAPGAYDGTGARIAEKLGFQALYVSGFQTSASVLGQPDVGYLTLTQMAQRVSRLAGVVDIPLIADADTGYGNPLNARPAVRAYEKLGAAAMHIEDQTFPKKIKAAVDARSDPDFLIIARTDARTSMGLDEALTRGAAYRDAGADVLFIESPESEEEMQRICEAFRGTVPVLSNQSEGGRTPTPGTRRLEEMGFALAIFAVGTALAAAEGMHDYLHTLASTGDTGQFRDRMISFDDFNALIGLDEHAELEQRYATRGH